MKNLSGIQSVWAKSRIPEQIHTVGLSVSGLPGSRVRSRSIPPSPQPIARFFLQIGENGVIIFVVEFLICKIDACVGMIFVDYGSHFFHKFNKR